MVEREALFKALNEALAQENACNIRYLTHATVLEGAYADTIGARLKEIAEDEREHAQELRDLIDYMGGDPTLDASKEHLVPAKELQEILDVNISEESKAVTMYRNILRTVDKFEMTWLYETLEDIIEDEEEHLYELRTLKGK